MKGDDNLIAMRKLGKAPRIVFVNDYPCKTDWFENHEHATISTAGEPISSLDLRFLTGLKVSISSGSEGRAKALMAKAKWFGAKTIGACHIQPVYAHLQTGWSEIYHAPEVIHG